tara:strand:- start:4432 stop:5100 length:669 start_codon:yes stop_codon:yes gene_type:complete
MPVLYATRKMLKELNQTDYSSIDVDDIILDRTIWYDMNHYIDENDMIQVNTVDFLTLLAKEHDIVSVLITNIKELEIDVLSNINSIEHIKIENVESITFSDFNNNLKHLEINYCALSYPPVIPDNLIILDLSMNLIDSLEHMEIPKSLKKINLNDNNFQIFPQLRDNLEEVYLCNNYLNNISNLPKNLKKLFIRNNNINEQFEINSTIITDLINNTINVSAQ